MNAEQHRMTADVIDLLEKDSSNWKNIHWYAISDGEWYPHESREDAQESVDKGRIMRIKPGPISRPWSKPDDVPGPVCWIRRDARYHGAMIVGITDDTIITSNLCDLVELTWEKAAINEYSTDRKTWHKCEVTE